MAEIKTRLKKNGKPRYTAVIRIKGFPTMCKTFSRLTDLRIWVSENELQMRRTKEAREDGMLKINIDSAVKSITFNNFTESQLSTIIENAIVAINKKKAERQGETADVGFWDGKGDYIEDRQKLTPEEIIEIGKNAEVQYVKNNNN